MIVKTEKIHEICFPLVNRMPLIDAASEWNDRLETCTSISKLKE